MVRTGNSEPASLPAVQAAGLVRRFGGTLALGGVDLTLDRGQRVVLLGPNGSGKTTLIRVLSLALAPHAGALFIDGKDALREPTACRRLVGVVGHRTGLYEDLTARENLRFSGRLYGVTELEEQVERRLVEFGVESIADQPLRTLSRGMQQRVALARAVLHEPLVLLLDEPETGLDEEAQQRLAAQLEALANERRAVLVATHRLEWAARIADQTVVMKQGAVVWSGQLSAWSGQLSAISSQLNPGG